MVNSPERFAIAKWMPALLVGGLVAALVGRRAHRPRGSRRERGAAATASTCAELTVARRQHAGAGRCRRRAAIAARFRPAGRLARDARGACWARSSEGRSPFAALSSESARRLGGETGLEHAARVLEAGAGRARRCRASSRKSAAESRAILGRVLAATGNAVSAPGGLTAMRVLPRFETVAQRTSDDLEQLEAAVNPAEVSRRITENTALLAQFLAGLAGTDTTAGVPAVGGEAATRLGEVQTAFAAYEQQLQGTLERAGALATAQRAAADLGTAADKLSKSLEAQSAGERRRRRDGSTPALVALAVAILCFAGALWGWTSQAGMRRVASLESERNRRNQDAILRLLDEMSSLADGDLTVQATVTDDITGAIADSINYAIEALRELVATINDTAMQLDQATRQTQAAAGHLAKASVAQSRQVAAATDAVSAMAASIEEVSGNAERSADVARHAVDVAHKGGDAVRRTIDGMNTIRENIQDTSKRIKRLGESSQEIGNIVELINDIAEQTNILALNASIQASMAGESGRGFAVVADEVQRLAERAGPRDAPDRGPRPHHPVGHQRGGGLHGAHHDRRRGRRAARRERRRRARRDRGRLQPDRAARAEHFRERAPAGGDLGPHLAHHAGAARDQPADRGQHERDLGRDRPARRHVGAAAQVRVRVQPAAAAAGPRPQDQARAGARRRGERGDAARGERRRLIRRGGLPLGQRAGTAPRRARARRDAERRAHRARGRGRDAGGQGRRSARRPSSCASARGVLRVVEVYGAALLAEEMEQTSRWMAGSETDARQYVDGLDALMRSSVQLPTYLERVLGGGRDLALVLLPLLNDLRAVRGAPLLSEGTLLSLNLSSEQAPAARETVAPDRADDGSAVGPAPAAEIPGGPARVHSRRGRLTAASRRSARSRTAWRSSRPPRPCTSSGG